MYKCWNELLHHWRSSFKTDAGQLLHTTVLRPFVLDYLGEPVPEETFTHSHLSWSSTILYQLPPFTAIHSILPVHFVLDSLFAQPLSKSSLFYLLVWHPPLHTPYISSLSHCLLFTTPLEQDQPTATSTKNLVKGEVQSIAMSMFVCLSSVCLFAWLKKHMAKLHQIFCVCCLRPWLGPALAVPWYVMFFQFCGWCHVFTWLCGASCVCPSGDRSDKQVFIMSCYWGQSLLTTIVLLNICCPLLDLPLGNNYWVQNITLYINVCSVAVIGVDPEDGLPKTKELIFCAVLQIYWY